ncbi:MAG: VWA domain-containing protein [Bacteroidales bacterium]|nr:VWA domain-containing protein [Bacteroidales bacterium]
MKRALTLFLFLGLFLYVGAQEEYYIEGFYQRHGEGKYTLTQVHTQGITIDGKTDFPDEVFPGDKVNIKCNKLDANLIRFSFDKVVTECSTWRGLRFQYWDDDNDKWKDDVEACMGEVKRYSQKDMVMMLVLDYSSSMSSNTSRLKSMSIDFIRSISKVSSGNVHVGVIAFAGMDKAKSQIFPITPLNESNRAQFEEFIRNSSQGTETALYYSMDNAIKMMEKYVLDRNFDPQKFNGTCMVTFTDGLDNASINDDISLIMHRGSKNEYLAYLSGQLQGSSCKKILGMPLEHFAVGFTGSENFTKEDMNLFENVLQRTTSDKDHFTLVTRFEEVEAYFKYIISQLTERWQTLNVYVGEAQHGKVRWVLECGDAPKKEKPERDFLICPLFGLNVGGGGGYSKPTQFIEFSAGLDLAFACGPKFALGIYGSYKGTFQTIHQGAVGLDFMIGPQHKAFLLGLGCNLMDRYYTSFYSFGKSIERHCGFNAGGGHTIRWCLQRLLFLL